ncbi:hypothetical protein Tco_0885421 [Tanacetum coccineum]
MTTLADKAILSGADNRPPILKKDMYDSWKSKIELYMMNRQHGRMIFKSVENGPPIWPTIKENGVTRPKKYSELSATEAIQADLQGRQISFATGNKKYQQTKEHVEANSWETKVAIMANLSHYGSDALAEVHDPDNVDNNMINQGVQVMLSSEQSMSHPAKAETRGVNKVSSHGAYHINDSN